MKNEYITAINNMLNNCQDMELIDFIYQLLYKRTKHVAET